MSARTTLSRLRVAAGAAGTTDVAPKAYADRLVTQAAGVGKVRPTPQPMGIGVDASYSAFPGVVYFPDTGQMRMVWRQGTDHVTARDGVIRTSVSSDLGRTWGTASTTLSDGTAPDLRDPSISVTTDLVTTILTYFKGSSGNSMQGAFVRLSTDRGATWGSETRIDTQTAAAISAPVVHLANGTLLATYYGKASGDTFDSCWIATSTNGGTSWNTPVRVANGQTASTNYQEPWAVAAGATVRIFYRHGSTSIGMLESTNSGGSWTSPTAVISSATGRPSAAWMSSGTIVLQYRRTSDAACCLRTSKTGAVNTWFPETLMFTGTTSLAMLYCAPVEVAYGSVYCPSAKELSGSSARISSIYLTEGAGTSPLGNSIPNGYGAIANDIDLIAFADNFHYVNGTVPSPWSTGGGAITISEGRLASGNADNTPDYAIVNTGVADCYIEADLWWQGAQAGFGIILRWVDSSNFMYFTVETGGTALRLYKVVSGTTTSVAGPATEALVASAWHRFALSARSGRVVCYTNDGAVAFGYTLDGGESALFNASTTHGVKLNPAVSGQHYCRRFLVRS